MKLKLGTLIFLIGHGLVGHAAHAQETTHAHGSAECDEMTTINYSTAMCEGRAMPGMPMRMLMIHGNGFLVGNLEEGPRSQNKISAPHMIMADIGSSFGDSHFVNLDVMATFERWTLPETGNPLLLQIGEENSSHVPYVDAQHPHSSPVMGLTLSDTFSIGETDHLKFFAAPRGESTEGPTAFMHRPSGEVNPDAPLGHHIGQDVGHISSSVIGGELRLGRTNLEASTFYGKEPQPSQADLPISAPNSYAFRLTEQVTPTVHVMASVAFVRSPEPNDPDLDHIWRYSASMYSNSVYRGWSFQDAFIYGLVNLYDGAGALNSFLYEANVATEKSDSWVRVEALQRTPNELTISKSNDRSTGRYVELLTVGHAKTIFQAESGRLQLGGSLTKDFLPVDYQNDYGGNPLTAKIFLRLSGMQMWTL
jgi:hypothetical protein